MSTASKRTGSFIAKDSNGKTYRIDIYTDVIRESAFGETPFGEQVEVEGLKSLRLSDGSAQVERVSQGQYKIFSPFGDIHLTSDDPNAP